MTSRFFVMLRNEASVCDRFCVAALAQNTDPSFVGMTKDAGMTKSRGDDKLVFCHAEERRSVYDLFCVAALAQKADPSFVGMTKDAGMTKSCGDDKPVFCHAEERSICMRFFLRRGTCAEYRSLLRRDDKECRDGKRCRALRLVMLRNGALMAKS